MKRALLLCLMAVVGFTAKSQCTIEVNWDSNGFWGDEITWQLLDASMTPVLSGGPYGNAPWTDIQSVVGTPPYTFVITPTVGASICDNTANYQVSVGGVVAVSGTHIPCATETFPITTACPACPAPGGLSAVVTLPSTVDLSWSAVGAATDYTLEYRVVGAGTWTSFAGNPVSGTTANVTGLTTDDYEWRVVSNCAGPITSTTASGTFTTIPYPGTCATAFPVGPGIFSAPGPTSGGGALNLCASFGVNANWYAYTATANGTATVSSDLPGTSGDTYVEIYTGTCAGLTCLAFDDDGGVINGFASIVSFPVCAGTTYYIEWDDSYFSGSNPFDFEITEVAGCPDPNTVQALAINTDGLTAVEWTAGGAQCGGTYAWEVVLLGDPQFAGSDVASGTGTYPLTPFDITGLMPGTDYEFLLLEDCGGGSFSNIVVAGFTTLPLGYPGTCLTAIPVVPGSYAAPGPSNGFGAANICGGFGTNANWYEYTATISGVATVSSDSSVNVGLDTYVSIYDGSCGALNCVAEDDDSGLGFLSIVTFPVCAGTTYYIEWDDSWGASGQAPFAFELSETAICAEPTGPFLVSSFNLDGLSGLTFSPGGGICGGGYEWEVILPGNPPFAGNDIVSGSGTYPLTPFDVTGLMPSTDYEIAIRDNCGAGSFSNAVVLTFTTASPPPVNDECVDAIVVYSGYTITGFSTAGATGTDITSCTFNDIASVWFEYTPTCNTTVEINSCGSTYDTNLSVFDACSGGTELACNDDAAAGPCSGTLQSFVSFAAVANTTYYIRVAGFNGSTGDINFSVIETTPCPCTINVWTGAVDNDWDNAGNWSCGAVPTNACGGGSDNAVIPAGSAVTPVVALATTMGVGNLQVATGSSIVVDGVLEICGNVVHNGTPLTGGGSEQLMGSVMQDISGNGTFNNLFMLNGGAGAQVLAGSNIKISNSLFAGLSGTFSNNGSVTLLSNAAVTAHLNDMAGGTYVGNITVQRFITPGSGLGQRFFGSAVSGGNVSGLDGTYAGGGLGQVTPLPTCDPLNLAAGSNYSNLFEWNEAGPFSTGCYQWGWYAMNAASALTAAKGYSGWMNDGSVLSVTGPPNTGPVSFGATSTTPSGIIEAQGWHLLSNPYPTPLSAQSALDDGFSSLQYYNGASAPFSGTFQPVLTSPTGLILPIMQGFAAQTSGNAFTPDNTYRLATNQPAFYKSNNWFDYKLDVEVTSNGKADMTYLFYSDVNSTQFDAETDCIKRHSDADKITLYTKMNSDELSLNGLHLNDLGQSIPMGIIVPSTATYAFNFDGMASFPANTNIYVEDLVTGVYHNVENGPYDFTADPSQNGTDRFMIHFVLPASFNLIEPSCENDAAVIVENTNDGRTFNISNAGVLEGTGVLDGSANVLSFGDYEIEVFDAFGGSQTYVFVIEEVVAVDAAVIASATTIEVGESVNFDYAGNGATTYEWFVNGQLSAQTEMFNYQFNTAGTYQVEVSAANNICDASAVQTIVVNEKTTSIVEINGIGSLSIYPNDKGDVVLQFNKVNKGMVQASIYNLLGQELASVHVDSNGKQVVSNNNWANGYYIVRVQVGDQLINQTVLLNK